MSAKAIVECKSTGSRLPEAIAREVDELFQTLPAECQFQRKAFLPEQITFEPGERADVSIITSNTVDKMDEVVLPHGVDLDLYQKSGMPVLWNHDQGLPPAGRCQWVKFHNDSLRAKTVYPERMGETKDDRPFWFDQIWDMVQGGVLRAKSIGFLPRTPKREATAEELELHPEWKGAGLWDDVVMIEYSVCNIGINNDALVEAVNTKSVSMDALKAMGLEVAMPMPVPEVKSVVVPEVIVPQVKGLTAREAIAFAKCHAKSHKKKAPARKPVDIDALLASVIDGVSLDMDRIARMAVTEYRGRGRV